ncbi:MAG: dicarboxylate transporter/tellurite-resistance protein TehA [Hyphomicrobiales bacterium]|nr:dicarboxylate transporter/tellurite-resistance protein TehA [Hyphomicrobiales bacterium]
MTAAPPFAARIPAAFFAMVLGLGGLANGWRVAAKLWGLPNAIGDAVSLLACAVWLVVFAAMVAKWTAARKAAIGEATHPVAGGFLALAPLSGMIATLAALPLLGMIGKALLLVFVAAQIAFALWYVGRLWTGGRGAEATTPVLLLPTVGGSFVAAMALSALGVADAAKMAFGAGLLSWIVIEALLWQRFLHQPALPPPIRATIGIHMAPPAVGLVSWLSVTSGAPDALALGLFGYALLQAAIMARLIPWIRQQPFGAPYWAFSFAVAALPLGAMRMVERGAEGTVALLAPALFVLANLIIGGFFVLSVMRMAQGKYVPPLQPPTPAPTP